MKQFNNFSPNQRLLGLIILVLLVGAVLVFMFGGDFISTLVTGMRKGKPGLDPVKYSKYLDKVSPHHRALIHKFKYNPKKDTLTFQGTEETYLEIPPLDRTPSSQSDAYSFGVEIYEKGKNAKLAGWRNFRKFQLKPDSKGEILLKFFTPSDSSQYLNIKSKKDKTYLKSPLELVPQSR